ncbi:hypothetical protein LF845_01905 [Deferribacterales bacterium Es71-Z0220]|jgi:hypothetical protein|uniref:hypothetical protein n=1 Tax=Deferrivibrio essentukiensis TaxID=2880922 RepID=UPI001F615677|nr:hypothetical protein [Deferrivibrio essentukiensis]MBZ4672961.1 hypothetical protein [Deferribacteraceae bacterium]MCB4203712.1 hypothetical protein [Deferrivibrio essentukiensis]
MRLELLELRKELVVARDFVDELTEEEKEELEEAKTYYETQYTKLSDDDKSWLDTQFNEWLEIYLSESGGCGSGCSGCSCPSH